MPEPEALDPEEPLAEELVPELLAPEASTPELPVPDVVALELSVEDEPLLVSVAVPLFEVEPEFEPAEVLEFMLDPEPAVPEPEFIPEALSRCP